MIQVGVVGHVGYDRLREVLDDLLRLADELSLRLYFEDELYAVAGGGERMTDPEVADVLLTLGGDGTLLRGARLLAGRPVPILGLNMGRLGFLTAVGGDDLEFALRRLSAGEYQVEERMALEVRALDMQGVERRRLLGLNDAVLHKGGFARVLGLTVYVDDEQIARFSADGVVISTPTGSTGYSLSAGGPVVVPTVESLILTPISAHTLALRPLVLPPTVELRIQPNDGPEQLLVTVDGQGGTTFAPGETLAVRRADRPVPIIRFHGSSFFARLSRKLGWGGLAQRGEDHRPC